MTGSTTIALVKSDLRSSGSTCLNWSAIAHVFETVDVIARRQVIPFVKAWRPPNTVLFSGENTSSLVISPMVAAATKHEQAISVPIARSVRRAGGSGFLAREHNPRLVTRPFALNDNVDTHLTSGRARSIARRSISRRFPPGSPSTYHPRTTLNPARLKAARCAKLQGISLLLEPFLESHLDALFFVAHVVPAGPVVFDCSFALRGAFASTGGRARRGAKSYSIRHLRQFQALPVADRCPPPVGWFRADPVVLAPGPFGRPQVAPTRDGQWPEPTVSATAPHLHPHRHRALLLRTPAGYGGRASSAESWKVRANGSANKEDSPRFHCGNAKAKATRSSRVTAYDVAFARLAERAGVDIVLVGDKPGHGGAGCSSTLPVTPTRWCTQSRGGPGVSSAHWSSTCHS